MWQISPHPVPCCIKNGPKVYPVALKFCKRTLKGILPHDTLLHNFLINCNTLSHNFSQKRTPCCIIFTVKGHPVELHIRSSQVWEYRRDCIQAPCCERRRSEITIVIQPTFCDVHAYVYCIALLLLIIYYRWLV